MAALANEVINPLLPARCQNSSDDLWAGVSRRWAGPGPCRCGCCTWPRCGCWAGGPRWRLGCDIGAEVMVPRREVAVLCSRVGRMRLSWPGPGGAVGSGQRLYRDRWAEIGSSPPATRLCRHRHRGLRHRR